MRKIGIQLYMTRESAKKDFVGTLKQLAAMGYAGVEAAGFFGGLNPQEVRALLSDLNLTLFSGHVGLDGLGGDFDRLCADYAAMGAEYIGLAWLPPDLRTAEGYTRAASALTKAAPVASRHGLRLFYHNHDFEFAPLCDGRTGMQILTTQTPPAVQFELDVYWAAYAGQSPITEIGKLEDRLPLLHVKDMDAQTRKDAITGEGILDMGAILAAAETAGCDWFVVEMDNAPKGEMHSAQASMKNILTRGWAA
ncbi:MAG TPA: sugar phosphate isomerase/epimerase [Thermoflexales bacterium]|nr:sugar phosphate isomerase/epimerase [Thermoflexales bacterium]